MAEPAVKITDRLADQTNSRPAKRPIDPRAALQSTLRSWLACRDTLLLNFCPMSDGETVLPEIRPGEAQADADRMNQLRTLAFHFANLLADRTQSPDMVIAQTIADLLSTDSPAFSLAVDSLPGSF